MSSSYSYYIYIYINIYLNKDTKATTRSKVKLLSVTCSLQHGLTGVLSQSVSLTDNCTNRRLVCVTYALYSYQLLYTYTLYSSHRPLTCADRRELSTI